MDPLVSCRPPKFSFCVPLPNEGHTCGNLKWSHVDLFECHFLVGSALQLFSHFIKSVTRTWKGALSFCLDTKVISCAVARKGTALPASTPLLPAPHSTHTPRERRRGYSQYKLFFKEMTSWVQSWPIFWDDCRVLIYYPGFNRSHHGERWPSWARKQKPVITRERPPIAQLSKPSETEWRGGGASSPHTSDSLSQLLSVFFKFLQRTHPLILQLRYLQALANSHLETSKEKISCLGWEGEGGNVTPTATVCPWNWTLGHELTFILYFILISATES